MWYHSLKTRQTVKRIDTRNSNGRAVALEYVDRKVEVHNILKETNPLTFDEPTTVIFVLPPEANMVVIAFSMSPKGKSTLEFRAWEMATGGAFVQRDVTMKDVMGSCMNDGKSKALWNLPDTSNALFGIRTDSLDNLFAASLGASLICIWSCFKLMNREKFTWQDQMRFFTRIIESLKRCTHTASGVDKICEIFGQFPWDKSFTAASDR